MKLTNKIFEAFIKEHATIQTQNRFRDSQILSLDWDLHEINAEVLGTMAYHVRIQYNSEEVVDAKCTCPYDFGGICKHIVHALVEVDRRMNPHIPPETLSKSSSVLPQNHLKKEGKTFILEGQKILDLDEKTIKELSRKRNAARLLDTYEIDRVEMPPDTFVAE